MMGTMTTATCAECGTSFQKRTGCYNRAIKQGLNLYCSDKCSALGRRSQRSPTLDELSGDDYKVWLRAYEREDKAKYDHEYRKQEHVRKRKREQWLADGKRTYARKKARMENDAEYKKRVKEAQEACCSTPEYKERKKSYDRKYKSRKNYGVYAEAHIALLNLTDEINERTTQTRSK